MLRVVFMGTPEFAVPSLLALAQHHDVRLVVTRPDAVSHRGGVPSAPAVKSAAGRSGIDVMQPERLDATAISAIADASPDVICVAAFGMLLPPALLDVPTFGCVNVHASLLPRYRGAAPIQRAILGGETVTGVSIMMMEAGLDTGPYALQVPLVIDDLYAHELEGRLADAGAEALIEVLSLMERGEASWVPQDAALATYAPKVTKDDVALTPELKATEAFLRVRAATRRAPARACVGDREITVVRAMPLELALEAGTTCVVDGTPVLGLAEGSLRLERVRPAGKSEMSGADWARGARLSADVCWRCTR